METLVEEAVLPPALSALPLPAGVLSALLPLERAADGDADIDGDLEPGPDLFPVLPVLPVLPADADAPPDDEEDARLALAAGGRLLQASASSLGLGLLGE